MMSLTPLSMVDTMSSTKSTSGPLSAMSQDLSFSICTRLAHNVQGLLLSSVRGAQVSKAQHLEAFLFQWLDQVLHVTVEVIGEIFDFGGAVQDFNFKKELN